MDGIVSVQNSRVEALNPKVNVFEDRTFKKVIMGNCVYKVGPNPIELVSFGEEEGKH